MELKIKRSARVPLILLPALALACADKPEARRCVDRNNNLVDEKRCEGVAPNAGSSGSSPFFWYYAGTMMGNRMSGGHYAPTPGYSYLSPGGRGFSAPSIGGGHVGGSSVRGISGHVGSGISVGA